MHTSLRTPALLTLFALSMAAGATPRAAAPAANDFPTSERVLYVQQCMQAHPGPQFEMINKCSCALDALARDVKYDDYMTMSTITKAISIGGERGGTVRDVPSYQPLIKRYKELQTKAEKGCFINADAK
jgi:hypothetical protein